MNRLLNTLERLESRLSRLTSVCNAFNNSMSKTQGQQKAESALAKVSTALDRSQQSYRQAGNSTSAYTQVVQNLVNNLTQLVQVNINVDNSVRQINSTTNTVNTRLNQYNRVAQTARERTQNFSTAQKSLLKSVSSTVARLYIMFMALKSVATKLADAYNASNDFIEAQNLFDVTMRNNADSAKEFAGAVERIMGINLAEWLSFQGRFKQLASGFGVVNEQADIMSKNLTQLSYDMASFFNTTNQKAFEKLSSAMAGQVKGLREFGIDTSNASLEQYALAKGIDLSVRKMTQAQKAVLRYNYILEKSINIQGDLARTITTPANAMRVLNAQIEQLRRAIGNIISMVVTQFIPYIQAAVILLTDWANSLAKEWGFELPKIDYSNLDQAVSITDDIADDFNDVADNIEEATSEAKKFKLQLMGFDELNILKSPKEDSAGKDKTKLDDIVNNYPSDLGLGVPEYDFGLDKVSSKARDIAEKIKNFFDIPDLLTLLDRIKTLYTWVRSKLPKPLQQLMDILTAVFAIKGIMALIGKVKTLWGLLKVSAIGKFFSAFVTGWKNADTGTNRFMAGLKEARSGLTGLQKAAIVTGATIIANITAKDFFYKLKTDSLDAASAVMDVVGVVGSLATSFAVGGWIGLAITAFGTLLGALTGFTDGIKDNINERIKNAFYDNVGTPISEIADSMTNMTDNVKEFYDKYTQGFEEIGKSQGSIETTVENVNLIKSAFDNGAISAEDACARISNAVKDLPNQVKQYATDLYNAVYGALQTPFGDAAEAAGMSKAKILEYAGDITGSITVKADVLNEKLTQLKSDLDNGRISSEDYTQKTATYTAQLNDLIKKPSGEASEAVNQLQKSINELDLSAIDWGNDEERSNALAKIAESASGAKDSINKFYDELNETLKTYRENATTTEGKNFFQDLLDVSDKSRNEELQKLSKVAEDFAGQVRSTVLETMSGKLAEQYKNADPFEIAWLGDATYQKQMLVDFKNDVLAPLDEDMNKLLKGFGSKTASESAEWLSLGISRMAQENSDSNFSWDKLSKYFNKHSTEIAESSATEYAKKYSEKQNQQIINNLLNPDTSLTRQFNNTFSSIGANSANSFSQGFNNNLSLVVPSIPVYSQPIGPMPKQYADGGFPTMGEMFIARENGPELVGNINGRTAVANNGEIMQGIAQGVYNAMIAANGSGSGGNGQDIRVVFTLDGDVLGEKVIKYHNDQVMVTGVSPLKV